MESRWQTALRASIPDTVLAEMVGNSGRRPEDARWSQVEMLIALVADRLGQILNATVQAGGGEPLDIPPIRRPGVTPEPDAKAPETPDEKAARRAAMKARIDATGTATTPT
ncbi:hypothetical protein [Embleya sp. NPDC001921]